MKLALGTAQFGSKYGVANKDGQVTKFVAKQILCKAEEAGIDTLDTAISYGESEQCLGDLGINDWRVITKLPKISKECKNLQGWVLNEVTNSLNRLNVTNISGLMLHRPNQLLEPIGKELWSIMQSLKENKIVEKIGFSIYDPIELDLLWKDFQPDIIQAPYNILDQRLKESGWLQNLYHNRVEVHVRSIFLQGLLLMKKEQRPKKFEKWNSFWSTWDNWLIDEHLDPLEACLAIVANEPMIDYAVVGVENVKQFEEIMLVIEKEESINVPTYFTYNNLDLINPSNW